MAATLLAPGELMTSARFGSIKCVQKHCLCSLSFRQQIPGGAAVGVAIGGMQGSSSPGLQITAAASDSRAFPEKRIMAAKHINTTRPIFLFVILDNIRKQRAEDRIYPFFFFFPLAKEVDMIFGLVKAGQSILGVNDGGLNS